MSEITGYKISPSGGRVSLAKIHGLRLLAEGRGDNILTDIENITPQELDFQCNKGYEFTLSGKKYRRSKGCPLGITNFLSDRLNTLKNKTPFPFEALVVYEGCGSTVREIETELKRKYKSARFSTKFDGSTEWKIFPTLEDINDMPLERGLSLYGGGET